jgi:hypothetical protein
VKQSPRFPIDDPKTFWKDSLVPSWLSPISDFYANFAAIFREEWISQKDRVKKYEAIQLTSAPILWKTNGDELIYYKDVSDRRELFVCLQAWKAAVLKYQAQLRTTGPLDIKATAWTAGFPVTNVEIVFESKITPDIETPMSVVPLSEDPRINQFALLSQFYEGDKGNLVLDFLGPSIDTGFRLTSKATPRKMAISVDVAYFLSVNNNMPAQSSKEESLKPFEIRFEGNVDLKGVLAGKPYPLFWIDMHSDHAFALAEDKIQLARSLPLKDVGDFCEAFYADNDAFLMKPFIVYEDKNLYGEIPERYIECLEHLRDRWTSEKQRLEVEAKALEGQSPDTDLKGEQLAAVPKQGDLVSRILSKAVKPKTDP